MTRSLDVATQGAIRARGALVPRNFVVVTAKDRTTGDPQEHGFWDDAETGPEGRARDFAEPEANRHLCHLRF